MKINRVWAVYWSATGNTAAVVSAAADALAKALDCPRETADFTLPQARERELSFGPDELAVLGTPTYAGRVPNKLVPYIRERIRGGGALAAAAVTFGNRSFDNALAELCALLEADGFCTVAAAAFVGQHAFAAQLAPGRPDAGDLRQAEAFAVRIAEKVRGLAEPPAPVQVPGDPDAPYYVSKGMDGQPAKFLKAKPLADPEKCTRCGLCARLCPMGAIDPGDVSQVPGTCIKCQSCVAHCPQGARYFDDPAFLSHRAMLEESFRDRKEPVFFL